MEYNFKAIEEKWKTNWASNNLYKVENEFSKPKYYILDMFPYPSGSGLHVGHPLGYIASDIVARKMKMDGYNVLHPMGFDAFGLPAEQYAIQTGIHPSVSTEENINRYKSQLNNIGLSFDWSREVNTSKPDYYKWTQWIFLQLYQHYYNTEKQQARPIEELKARFSQSGNSNIQAQTTDEKVFNASEWNAMTPAEKDEVLMNYRLAYRKVSFVNWCEALGTVLANDEVKDGFSERGGHPVIKKPMMQWALRITAYAERLLEGLDRVNWTESLKLMQRNWIGKSTGARIFFQIEGSEEKIEVFTTRPDTLFGCSFIVLAPEHSAVDQICSTDQRNKVHEYINNVQKKSDQSSDVANTTVTGVFSGAYAIHPVSNEKIPIWISDYVLIDYGTGAIMAVPGHDQRDQSFAKKFKLPIKTVIDLTKFEDAAIEDKRGQLINSDFLDGLEVHDAMEKMISYLESVKAGSPKVQYKLRDANFSRQRYWGEPIPILYAKDGSSHMIPLEDLPLELPYLETIQSGEGGSAPLSRAGDWLKVGEFVRETDTMPGYAGSSWYFLRYMDNENQNEFASSKASNYWQDVDLYIGGTEHAVGHLMYSRFWHKFLFDLGYVPTDEPFKKLVNQGMIQGVIESLYLLTTDDPDSTFNHSKQFVSAEIADQFNSRQLIKIPVHIEFISKYNTAEAHLNKEGIIKFLNWRPDFKTFRFTNGNESGTVEALTEHFKIYTCSETGKMSKRYHNVVNPDDVIDEYGADCFRMYEMFLGPIEQSKPWDTKGIDGVFKFLKKYTNLFYTEDDQFKLTNEIPDQEELKILHTCIKKVNSDIENLNLNTSVSAFMICVNDLKKHNCNKKEILLKLTQLLAPFAPFITEEIWQLAGHTTSVHLSEYPKHDESYLVSDTVNYPVSINGKKRYEWIVPKSMREDELKTEVLNIPEVAKWLETSEIKKIIVVPGKMINLVI